MRQDLERLTKRDITQEQTSYLIGCWVYVQGEIGEQLLEEKEVDEELKDIALKLASEIDRRIPIPAK